MIKLRTILAGTAVAVFSQFAAAQSYPPGTIVVPAAQAPSNPNDPAYTDQSRAPKTQDPLIKKRIADRGARAEYKTEEKEAKQQYKQEKTEAKSEYKDARKDSAAARDMEMQNAPPASGPAK
jgi:hypothetical protein